MYPVSKALRICPSWHSFAAEVDPPSGSSAKIRRNSLRKQSRPDGSRKAFVKCCVRSTLECLGVGKHRFHILGVSLNLHNFRETRLFRGGRDHADERSEALQFATSDADKILKVKGVVECISP